MQKNTFEKISQLESLKMKAASGDEPTSGVAPRFTVPIENKDNLREGENAHFEARLIPTDDPTLSIEWLVFLLTSYDLDIKNGVLFPKLF